MSFLVLVSVCLLLLSGHPLPRLFLDLGAFNWASSLGLPAVENMPSAAWCLRGKLTLRIFHSLLPLQPAGQLLADTEMGGTPPSRFPGS